MSVDQVVLLDSETDRPIGVVDKELAHTLGYYHSAISVILMDSAGRQLIQQRAMSKYHCAGLWSNACCTHPGPGENAFDTACRRLDQELGISTRLVPIGVVRYWAAVPTESSAADGIQKIWEHERVDIFGGFYDGAFDINFDEIADIRWMTKSDLITSTAMTLTPWFRLYLDLLGDNPKELLNGLMAATKSPQDFGYKTLET